MSKDEILALLNGCGVPYEFFSHPAVTTVEEADALRLPYPDAGAKNLFLSDGRQGYFLLTVREHAAVDLKKLRQRLGSGRLSLASEGDLESILRLHRGSVTPFGLLNDTEHRERFLLDESFRGERIAVHPNENTATLFLNADDLVHVLSRFGIEPEYISSEELA